MDLLLLLIFTTTYANAWAYATGIRSLRAALATGSFFTGFTETVATHRHQLEAKIKIQGSPRCRVLIYTPPDDDFNENTGVLVHFVRITLSYIMFLLFERADFHYSTPQLSWVPQQSMSTLSVFFGKYAYKNNKYTKNNND